MDNPKDEALKKVDEGDIQEATPAEEIKPAEEVTEPEAETESTEEVEAKEKVAETGESSKKGFSNRVRELNAKAKSAEERARDAEIKVESLSAKIEELMGSVEPSSQEQFIPQVEPGAEISPDQYKQDVMRTADGIVQLRIKQREVIDKINNDTREAEAKYPALDVKSDDFDKELSESITAGVEAHVRSSANPNVGKFIDKLMKPYKGAVEREVGKVGESLAKQASQTAVKPTSVTKGEKTFEELSEKEMEKKLGVVH